MATAMPSAGQHGRIYDDAGETRQTRWHLRTVQHMQVNRAAPVGAGALFAGKGIVFCDMEYSVSEKDN